jgi:hypothetical protein
LNQAGHSDEEEDVQPSRHEGEVGDPADEDERAADQEHA